MGAGPLQLSSGINPNLIRGGVSEPQPEQDREYGHWYLAQLKPGGFECTTFFKWQSMYGGWKCQTQRS